MQEDCKNCGKPLVKSFVRVGSEKYHKKCVFMCWKCDEKIRVKELSTLFYPAQICKACEKDALDNSEICEKYLLHDGEFEQEERL